MNQVTERISYIFLAALTLALGATMGGTMLWFVWEDSLTAMFPNAVASGILAAKLNWWQSVKIVWVFSLLIKAAVETKNSVKEIAEKNNANEHKKITLKKLFDIG